MIARVLAGSGLVATAVGVLAVRAGVADPVWPGGWPAVVAVGACLVVVAATVAWVGRTGTGRVISRWQRVADQSGGLPRARDHLASSSRWSHVRRAGRLLPSTRGMGRVARTRYAIQHVADYTYVLGASSVRRVAISAEQHLLTVAGPRSGKSQRMEDRVLKAPGGVVVTSTRPDDLLTTMPSRMARGPVHLYDPGGVSAIGSTFKWSPLAGCRAPAVALRRAADMVPRVDESGDRAFWNALARETLAAMMHAAACSGGNMRTVAGWLATTNKSVTLSVIERALASSPSGDLMSAPIRDYFSYPDRQRASVQMTARQALGWLLDPRAAAVGDGSAEESADLRDVIDRRGTLYVLGRKDGQTGRLTAALLGEVMALAEEAANANGGRLEPHLTVVLDEAAKVSPGPIDEWMTDFGGKGIVFDVAVQSLAAMRDVWSDVQTEKIIQLCKILVGAGCSDPRDAERWERLAGTKDREVASLGPDRKTVTGYSIQRVPVIPLAQIYGLEPFQFVVFGLGRASIIRTPAPFRNDKNGHRYRTKVMAAWPKETRYDTERTFIDLPMAEEESGD